MLRPSRLLPALVAAVATAVPVAAAPPATAAPSPWSTTRSAAATAVVAAEGDEPLRVTLGSLTPGFVPQSGRIELSGTVTNVSDERWRAINVHAFIDDVPLTSSAELAATLDTPVEAEVGTRITIPGTFDNIGGLAPGETASYSVSLRRNQLPVSAPGAYWFGAHALGNTTDVRDGVADGRARTLLPLVPEGSGRERASLVIPLRHAVRHAPDGRLRSTRRWNAELSDGGRLRDLVDLGAAAGASPVTWLVDPAVPDAVAQLADGNPSRALGADAPTDQPDRPDGTADPERATEDTPDDPGRAPGTGGVEPAAGWLSRLEVAIGGDEVLALPYGDLDVAAAAASAPHFYDRAVRRNGAQLSQWKVRSRPAVAPPEGFLPEDALSLLNGDETVLLSDRALEEGSVRTAAQVKGERLLFSSTDTAAGGPGPGDPLDEVALRQRVLAEAAVRLLFHDRTPLVTVFPDSWRPASPERFWEGLDEVPWLRLTDLSTLGPGGPLAGEELGYPVEQELLELDPENFTAAEQLIASGSTLDNVLPGTDQLARETLDQALASLSYGERLRALESRSATARSVAWIQRRLEKIRIRAPQGVTLSGAVGDMATTVTNRLDHPVTVVLRTVSLGEVEVADSDPIELAGGGRQTVLLEARPSGQGVQYVRVELTDEEGNPLGAAQRVAIRSAEVSQVIWLILGVGVGLLFVAIVIRLVRRVRRERGGSPT